MKIKEETYKFDQLFNKEDVLEHGIVTKVPMKITGTTIGPGITLPLDTEFGNIKITELVDKVLICTIDSGIVSIIGMGEEGNSETNNCMTVADAIAVLLEMDPTMLLVTPNAPYGQPELVNRDYINVINIDEPDGEFELTGSFCGIGFRALDENTFTDYDDLDEEDEEETPPEPEPVWHDGFVLNTPEQIKNIIDNIGDCEIIEE